jgi:hypothetical protein
MPGGEPPPDVELAASAWAAELRFRARPDVRVHYPGSGDRESSQRTTRKNMDSPVQLGRTYRRIYATTTIASRLIGPSCLRARDR